MKLTRKKRLTTYIAPSYHAEITAPGHMRAVWCGGGCNWRGRFYQLRAIDGCALTPGDPSPAGRCPECDALAYVVQQGHGA